LYHPASLEDQAKGVQMFAITAVVADMALYAFDLSQPELEITS
jgi:hypothetical protein